MKPETSATGMNREVAAGLILLGAAVLALIAANSPLKEMYEHLLAMHVQIGVAPFSLTKNVIHWVNDGLMVVFFFVVGLEIKREAIRGALSNRRAAMLPVIAALGGMLVPSVIYASINWDNPVALRGWAIPAATDIAFAVGIMALLGNRVPTALKVFLLALAIIDDLGAIIIIALFYTADLSVQALGLAALGVLGLIALNRSGVMRAWPYLLVGAFIWLCVLKSGVHATLAGVATALAIPLSGAKKGTNGPLVGLEHALSPWVSFLIVPIFAFANAGLTLTDLSTNDMLSQIPIGIALGLFIGKPLGIYGAVRFAVASGLGQMPHGASQTQLFGTAVLAGIGFTMSLFIGILAFPDPTSSAEVRFGVLAGSLMSAIVGYTILVRSAPTGGLGAKEHK
ncbi:Na+/H+ antiporter NhaA [Hyphomicrobium sp.]|uniref:Na+/H+ antiporter NhaA n=1 Tax=Hyphomicrobium sp. TaxID=82 RepID=UPI002D7A01F2|nr:Na+/H+ antiporter NhaA [Hyphomicrobium sp.]HET6388786.1 Na+/H+ antiporter NhaA [Hyphomicrobium sp.]